MDCSPPGSSVHEVLPARLLEWIAICFSRRYAWPRDWACTTCVSCLGRRMLCHWATRKSAIDMLLCYWYYWTYLCRELGFVLCCAQSLSRVRLFGTPWTTAARLLCPWDSPGKNTGVGSHALLQGIFPTQGLNPGLPHSRHILYRLSHQGSPN